MRCLLRSEQPGTVLAGVKARPCGWPTASLDPGCGRSRMTTGGADREKNRARSTHSSLYGSRGLPAVAAADLELGLGWADVAFGLVVGEGDAQVAREQQHLGVAVAQALKQVAGLGLTAPGNTAVLGEPDQQRVAPRVEQRIGDLWRDRREVLATGLVGGGVEAVQGAQRLLGPGLGGIGLGRGDEFAS